MIKTKLIAFCYVQGALRKKTKSPTENSRQRIPRTGAEKLTEAKDANTGQLNAVFKISHRGHVFLDTKDTNM